MVMFGRIVFVSNFTTIVQTAQPGNLSIKKKQHKIISRNTSGGTKIIDLNDTVRVSMIITLIYLFFKFYDISCIPNNATPISTTKVISD